jgi:hypothetical protein
MLQVGGGTADRKTPESRISAVSRPLRRLLAVLITGVSLLAPVPTAAQDSSSTTIDPVAARRENQQRQRRVAGEIDALRATNAEIQAALIELDVRLSQGRAAVEAAAAARASAEAEVAAAEAAVRVAEAEAQRTEAEVRQMAIEAYLHPPSEGVASILASRSFTEARQRQSLLSIRTRQRDAVLQRRRTALASLRRQRAAAAKAVTAARAAEEAQAAELARLEAARQEQQNLATSLDQRIEAGLAEAAILASVDAELSRQIDAQQAALAALVRQYQAVPTQPSPPPVVAAGPPPTTTSSPGTRPAPTTTRPSTTTTRPPLSYTPPAPLYTSADMVRVGNLWVNKLIGSQVAALLAAASAAGFTLSGGGYRDPAAQIQLRIAHCGPTDYDIYFRPSSECSPPTARPGFSMHEQGLAIDFTCNGVLITTQSNPCFVWLSTNAASYGLYNLPSEPWHWSVNGR